MNFDAFSWPDIVPNIGWLGVVIGIVIYIIRGKLIPASTYVARVGDKDLHITRLDREVEDWKAAAFAKDATIALLAQQLHEALESGRIANAVMEALPRAAPNV